MSVFAYAARPPGSSKLNSLISPRQRNTNQVAANLSTITSLVRSEYEPADAHKDAATYRAALAELYPIDKIKRGERYRISDKCLTMPFLWLSVEFNGKEGDELAALAVKRLKFYVLLLGKNGKLLSQSSIVGLTDRPLRFPSEIEMTDYRKKKRAKRNEVVFKVNPHNSDDEVSEIVFVACLHRSWVHNISMGNLDSLCIRLCDKSGSRERDLLQIQYLELGSEHRLANPSGMSYIELGRLSRISSPKLSWETPRLYEGLQAKPEVNWEFWVTGSSSKNGELSDVYQLFRPSASGERVDNRGVDLGKGSEIKGSIKIQFGYENKDASAKVLVLQCGADGKTISENHVISVSNTVSPDGAISLAPLGHDSPAVMDRFLLNIVYSRLEFSTHNIVVLLIVSSKKGVPGVAGLYGIKLLQEDTQGDCTCYIDVPRKVFTSAIELGIIRRQAPSQSTHLTKSVTLSTEGFSRQGSRAHSMMSHTSSMSQHAASNVVWKLESSGQQHSGNASSIVTSYCVTQNRDAARQRAPGTRMDIWAASPFVDKLMIGFSSNGNVEFEVAAFCSSKHNSKSYCVTSALPKSPGREITYFTGKKNAAKGFDLLLTEVPQHITNVVFVIYSGNFDCSGPLNVNNVEMIGTNGQGGENVFSYNSIVEDTSAASPRCFEVGRLNRTKQRWVLDTTSKIWDSSVTDVQRLFCSVRAKQLQKGTSIAIPSYMSKVDLGLGWSVNKVTQDKFDLDSVIFMLGERGELLHSVNWDQLEAPGVVHCGDSQDGGLPSQDDERISIDLLQVPPTVYSIVIWVIIFDASTRHQSFKDVSKCYIHLSDTSSNIELFHFSVGGDTKLASLEFGQIRRLVGSDGSSKWEFKAVGEDSEMNFESVQKLYRGVSRKPRD